MGSERTFAFPSHHFPQSEFKSAGTLQPEAVAHVPRVVPPNLPPGLYGQTLEWLLFAISDAQV